MSKGVHNIAFYVSPDPECSRTTQDSEISLAPSRGRILYAIYGNSTCVINHIVVTAIDKRYRNYYVSTLLCFIARLLLFLVILLGLPTFMCPMSSLAAIMAFALAVFLLALRPRSCKGFITSGLRSTTGSLRSSPTIFQSISLLADIVNE